MFRTRSALPCVVRGRPAAAAGGEGTARNGRVVVPIGRVDCLDNRFVGYLTSLSAVQRRRSR